MNNLILLGGIIIILLIIILLIIVIVKLQRDVSKKNENIPIINNPQSEKEYIFIKTKPQKLNNLNEKKDTPDLKKNNKIGNNLERIIEEKHNLAAKLHQLEQQLKTPAPSRPNQNSTPAPTHH